MEAHRFTVIFIIVYTISVMYGQAQIKSPAVDMYKSQIDSFLEISERYGDQGNVDSAMWYADQALSISIDNQLTESEGLTYYTIGYIYDINSELSNALDYYERSRLIYEELDNKTEVANSMNAKGVAAAFMGDFETSLRFYLETIAYCEEHDIDQVLINVLNNTGVNYRMTGKMAQAIEIYQKTLRLSRDMDNQSMIGTSYHNLGVAHNFLGEPEIALNYLDSAIRQNRLLEDPFEVARSVIARGETYYLSLKAYGNARNDLKDGLETIGQTGDQEVWLKTMLLLAQVERDAGRFKDSESYFKKGLSVIEGSDRKDLLSEYYEEMVELYEFTDEKSLAYDYQKKYIDLYKQIQSTQKLQAIEELQTQYQTKEREQEIALLNTQNQLQESQLKSSRRMTIGLAIGLALLGGLLTWLYRLNKIVKKSADEKETLLREIHHRVKNNLQVISALLTLQSSHLKDARAKSALQEGQDRVQSMALIHKDLYQHDNLKGVNTKDYLEQLVENLLRSYKIDESEVKLNLDIAEINLDVDTMIPMGLMVNELISNALKHAFKDSENAVLDISLTEQNDQLKMTIADNGSGVGDIEEMKKQSFGYSLVQSFARKLDADLHIESVDGLKIDLTIKNYLKV